jgi:hypothetical protein
MAGIEQLLARRPRAEKLTVPGWEDYYVQEIAARDQKAIMKMAEVDDGLEQLVALAVVDADGNRVLKDKIPELGKLPARELNEIVRAFNDLNGFSENGRKALGKGSSQTAPAISRSA